MNHLTALVVIAIGSAVVADYAWRIVWCFRMGRIRKWMQRSRKTDFRNVPELGIYSIKITWTAAEIRRDPKGFIRFVNTLTGGQNGNNGK